ncbi:MAG TPA: HD domain-containing phosphohydrolase [Acidimicrobiia bacterium]|nr:HD domain-containing phosphohydrolase [Acidimicrobiia bacterium]
MADGAPALRLTELLASLSLATDLGTGQPLGHGLSTCLLSVDLARAIGCRDDEVRAVHQVALLRFLGCTSDAAQTARAVGGDDIGFNAAMAPVFHGSGAGMMAAMVRTVGADSPPTSRARLIGAALMDVHGARRSLAAHCEVGAMLGKRLGLSEPVIEALRHAYERWDGRGYPSGRTGSQIPLAIRITQVARDVDVFHRAGADVSALLQHRQGKAYDPEVVDAWIRVGEPRREADWNEVLDAEPAPPSHVDDIEAGLSVVADFVDLKSPWMRGHSSAVADLAEATAMAMGLGAQACKTVRLAGLVHDVGRVGVENGIWDKPGPLSTDEWEKVRLHPYHTERVLSRCPALAPLADIACSHHERLDGSGYPRRAASDQLTLHARVLAAADALAALTAPRPHRAAMSMDEAAFLLEEDVRAGRLDTDAVGWVIATARGGGTRPRFANPGSLTDREVEVLTLIASGKSNKEMAKRLHISAKTVGRHVENIYRKIDVSTRAGATVYAMEHRLLG